MCNAYITDTCACASIDPVPCGFVSCAFALQTGGLKFATSYPWQSPIDFLSLNSGRSDAYGQFL